MTRIIENLSEISANYDAVFCDLWGCLHNGQRPFAEAVRALETYRDSGGIVLLLTNSPRPAPSVEVQLDGIGVARDLYQSVATSGDSARAALASGHYGTNVFHIGPERDLPFFAPDPSIPGLENINRVPLDKAEAIVCTGLFDDQTETPDDYAAIFLEAKNNGLDLLCANPDIVVDHGDKRIYCAGALAAEYTARGGTSHYFGKPHPPIYDLARRRLSEVAGREIENRRILCIGDGIHTDILGAINEDMDSLFISGGLAAEETATAPQPDPQKLETFLSSHSLSPAATIGHLR
ncbi:TIGR01459 family HAD-type hydrolase [Neptunicoccus cionae]|uniref:Haloacid dehalogenase n=1 Tax=Neptunicoccus cionae TaxID=2035344 RepID=A0A916QR28_9RHOB|nr:TIGR01459 family HAD-type hydrolase [Amylibacter cionae]GGA05237.1 haloacid dehalogenase [Amylibacter cionae]